MSVSDSDRNSNSRPAARDRDSEDYNDRPTPRKSAAPRPEGSGRSAGTSGRTERSPRPRSAALESLRSRTYTGAEDADSGYGYEGDRQRRAASDRASYGRPAGGYGGSSYGGGNYGGGGYGGGTARQAPEARPGWFKFSNLSIIALVALVMFFSGFAMRDVYTAEGGFDDERPIQAERVPAELRDFCIQYNGYPSFSLLSVDTISSLTASSVPVLKLDTCTIPTRETANALAALGVEKRSESIGLQLGGSNLTLVVVPVADRLAIQLYSAYPSLANDLRGSTRDEEIKVLEEAIATVLVDDINEITLQNVVKTNLPGVFAVAPGHSFPIQPDGRR